MNQMKIFDILLKAGGNKKYLDKENNLNYSEYSGVFDIEGSLIKRIVLNTIIDVKIKGLDDTLFPTNIYQIENYDFMFHTHPSLDEFIPTKTGVIYEFPSYNDLIHFIYFFNNGKPRGSITITNEGVYNTISTKKKGEQIRLENIEQKKKQISNVFSLIQYKAIFEYGKKFSKEFFYKEIAQNDKYIKMYNKAIKKIFDGQIKIKYYPRKYNKQLKEWILSDLYLL